MQVRENPFDRGLGDNYKTRMGKTKVGSKICLV